MSNNFSWLIIMLDAVETERGNSSPSKTQGRRQISSSSYSVREKLLREHTEGANNAEGCGEEEGIEIFFQLIFYKKS